MPTLATERTVYTYQPGQWPEGLLTGHDGAPGVFVVEHVVAFHKRALLPLVRAAIAEARARGYQVLVLHMPEAFPKTPGLCALALRVGFLEYARAEGWTSWSLHL